VEGAGDVRRPGTLALDRGPARSGEAHDALTAGQRRTHRRCRHKDEHRGQGHGARGSDRGDHLRPCLGNRQLRRPAGHRGQ
jgi:hypothetical protein